MWLVFLLVVLATVVACVLKKTGPSDGPGAESPTQNRPDTTGIPPKTQYILGAVFSNAELSGQGVGLVPGTRKISIPDFTSQSCYFNAIAGRSSFHWRFNYDESSPLEMRAFDVDLDMEGLPAAGQTFTILGASSGGSVSLQIPNLIDDVFGFWQLSAFSNESHCKLTTVRVLTADGTPATANFSGPFRMDSTMSCTLENFGSTQKQFLSFDADLGCTGDVTDKGSTKFNKWFISSSSQLVFELQSQPMARSLAQSFCKNKSIQYRSATQDELKSAKDDILKKLFPDQTTIPSLWAVPATGPTDLQVLGSWSGPQPILSQATDTTTAYVVCVH